MRAPLEQTMRSLNPNTTTPQTITLTITGNATGSAALGVVLAGGVCQVTTGSSATPSTTGAALKSAIEAAVSGVTVAHAAGVLTITGAGLLHAWAYSLDGTQSIVASGGGVDQAILASSTAGGGKPAGPSGGYAIDPGYATRDETGAATVLIRTVLGNTSGGAATAAWRLWVYTASLGWFVDPSVSVRNISDAGSSTGYATDDPIAVSVYGERIAVELIGKTSSGTNLDSGEILMVWASVV